MEKLPFAVFEIEKRRCDMNANLAELLTDSERFDEGRFWWLRRDFEKKWRHPDDGYIDVQQGLPAPARRFTTFL